MKIKRDTKDFQPITITIDDAVQWSTLKRSLWYTAVNEYRPNEMTQAAVAMYDEIMEFEKCQ